YTEKNKQLALIMSISKDAVNDYFTEPVIIKERDFLPINVFKDVKIVDGRQYLQDSSVRKKMLEMAKQDPNGFVPITEEELERMADGKNEYLDCKLLINGDMIGYFFMLNQKQLNNQLQNDYNLKGKIGKDIPADHVWMPGSNLWLPETFVDNENFIYPYHLVIDKKYQSKNFGEMALDEILEYKNNNILLAEIHPNNKPCLELAKNKANAEKKSQYKQLPYGIYLLN
ncbi:hypothetical protein ACFL1H_06365, partial [Nanoarchaeota archaeon]